MRDVMMLPHGVNMFSMSCCVMFFGRPLMYRFAPLMLSLLGRATDTCDDTRGKLVLIVAPTPVQYQERERYLTTTVTGLETNARPRRV